MRDIYAGISPADLGYEPAMPVATCPKCDGEVWPRQCPPRGLICRECGMVYDDAADLDAATAYYTGLLLDEYDQRDEDGSGHADAVAEGLERWTR